MAQGTKMIEKHLFSRGGCAGNRTPNQEIKSLLAGHIGRRQPGVSHPKPDVRQTTSTSMSPRETATSILTLAQRRQARALGRRLARDPSIQTVEQALAAVREALR